MRSLFVSDIHLGSKHTQVDGFLELLHKYQPQHLYIVGDFIDGWKLKRRWRWRTSYDHIFRRLLELKQSGTQLYYTPGNHDGFLRNFLADYGVIHLQDQFVHVAADGRRYLVIHGDQFDHVEQRMQWLSLIGTYVYDLLLSMNYWVSGLFGKQRSRYALCGIIKRRVKGIVKRVSDYESQLTAAAKEENCQGIICGHIHWPRITQINQFDYLNTGDWVENGSALVEYDDGAFELVRTDGRLLGELAASEKQSPQKDSLEPADQKPAESMSSVAAH